MSTRDSPAPSGRIESFLPIARHDARILILGSMPGEASLAAGEYYAHPRNAFWPILADLLGFAADAPYARRVRALEQAHVAVWDVLHSCIRPGSLDADIECDSLQVNDFGHFLAQHPAITHVFFNGSTAETCFRRHVLRLLAGRSLQFARLPSTSPAHAARSLSAKREAWRAILEALQPSRR